MDQVTQIVKLVKLLEAPAFSFMRLQLLEPARYAFYWFSVEYAVYMCTRPNKLPKYAEIMG